MNITYTVPKLLQQPCQIAYTSAAPTFKGVTLTFTISDYKNHHCQKRREFSLTEKVHIPCKPHM